MSLMGKFHWSQWWINESWTARTRVQKEYYYKKAQWSQVGQQSSHFFSGLYCEGDWMCLRSDPPSLYSSASSFWLIQQSPSLLLLTSTDNNSAHNKRSVQTHKAFTVHLFKRAVPPFLSLVVMTTFLERVCPSRKPRCHELLSGHKLALGGLWGRLL